MQAYTKDKVIMLQQNANAGLKESGKVFALLRTLKNKWDLYLSSYMPFTSVRIIWDFPRWDLLNKILFLICLVLSPFIHL